MTITNDLSNFGFIANAMYNSITANATAITSMSVGTANSANLTTTTNVATIGTSAYFVANGNVGIGTASPTAKLDIVGAANVSGNVTLSSSSFLYVSTNSFINATTHYVGNTSVNTNITAGQISISGVTVNSTIYQGTATFANSSSTNTFTIGTSAYFVANGNVGIGTASPTGKLHVVGGSKTDGVGTFLNGGSSEGGEINFLNPDNTTVGLYVDVAGTNNPRMFSIANNMVMHIGQLGSAANGIISLYTSSAERVRIDSSGNMGINQTSPTARLDVNGGIRALGGATYGTGVAGYSFGTNDTDGGMFSPADGTLVFATNNAERVRIDSNGNTGIGVTSPTYKLHVAGDVNAYRPGSPTTGVYYFGNGGNYLYFNGTNFETSAFLQAGGSLRAPIFYDSDDTGYYCNPNGQSRLNYLNLNTGTWNYSSEGWARLNFVYGDTSYYRGGASNQWSHGFRTQDDVTRWLFEAGGNIYATGNIIAYWSDRRLKKNIKKIDDWRDIINGLNGYRFEWNDIGNKILENTEPGVQIGLIAQEVKAVLPQAASVQLLQYKNKEADGTLTPKDDINYDPEDPYLTVDEKKLIPVLVEAVKGLLGEVEDLKKQLKLLQKE